LAARFRRLAARRGKKKAIIAVGHSILVSAYHLLAHGVTYADLDGIYFDEREARATERRLIRRAELGRDAEVRPASQAGRREFDSHPPSSGARVASNASNIGRSMT
jgi:hypothetical protein